MASEQEYTKEVPAATQKASLTEQAKEKVDDVKDKLTGQDHQSPAPHTGSEAHNTKTQSPKGESFLQKIKDKLPGSHAHEHTTPTTTPVQTTGTTGPATTTAHTVEPAQHQGIGGKISHFFKGGHSDVKTEQKKEEPRQMHEGDVHGVTEHDSLKD